MAGNCCPPVRASSSVRDLREDRSGSVGVPVPDVTGAFCCVEHFVVKALSRYLLYRRILLTIRWTMD
jgi:hypothetical protein